MTALIIEDEKKAAREIERILAAIDGSIKIVSVLESVEQAIIWFKLNEQPDVIFSDIQLADGLCFDIYKQIRVNSPVIFCTAYDDYLLNAFETNAVSYLLKPVTTEKVEQALHKLSGLKKAFNNGSSESPLEKLLQHLKPSYKTSLLINQKEKIIPIQVKDISFFYLSNNLLNLYTTNNQKYFISGTLDELEKTLDPSLFYRANRQFLINRNAIQSAENCFARKLVAKLHINTPESIIISKAKASDFLRWLESDYSK
jgi:two-component system, LytTR family, response regulator LytT